VQQAAAAVDQANRRAEQAEYNSITNALGAAQTEAESTQRNYAMALSEQDFQMAAEYQRQISRAENKILQLENGKEAYEQYLNRPRPQQPQPQMTVEQMLNNMPLTQQERAYLRNHPELVSDPTNNKRLEVAYIDSQQKGLERDSREYFDFLNSRLGYGTSRVTAGTLTAKQREAARDAGVSNEVYAE
jgi:hypothetical protein